jgi:transposase
MGKLTSNFKSSIEERQNRKFSESVKQRLVKEIEQKRSSVHEICKVHEVSPTAVYRWIKLYSHKERPTRTIVESKSDTTKILALQKKVADLERLLGQKQIIIDFQEKMIDIAEDTYKVDIKKKLGLKP